MKTIKALVLTVALVALQTSLAHADLKIGFAAEPFPPFSSKDAAGKWVGWEVEAIDAVCKAMNEKCDYVEVAWDGIIPALQAKKFDVIWSSMSITDKRKEVIDFTDRYYKTPAVMVGAKSETYSIDNKNADSLKGKIIGVQTSTIHAQYAQKYFGSAATVKVYDTQDNVNADLVAGRIDLDMADSIALDAFLKTDTGKDFEVKWTAPPDPIFGYGVGGGIRKDDTALKERLNKAIGAVRGNGTYDTIAKKYFNFNIYGS